MQTEQNILKFKKHLHKSMNSVLNKNLKILRGVLRVKVESLLKSYATDDQEFKIAAKRVINEFFYEYNKIFFGVVRKSKRKYTTIIDFFHE